MSEGIRIDPAPMGIMVVNEDYGGMQVFIQFNKIQSLIQNLKKVLKDLDMDDKDESE